MRIVAALMMITCLAACGGASTQSASEQELTVQGGWGQEQAVLDAQAILQGMAQARQRAEQQARIAP
jgi:hypothetical protein